MKNKRIIPIIFSIIFLVIAITILVDIIGWLQTDTIIGQYWPVLFILMGVISMSPNNREANAFSFGMAGLGIIFLMKNLGVFNTQAGETIMVVLLALFGLAVLAFATSKKDTNKDSDKNS